MRADDRRLHLDHPYGRSRREHLGGFVTLDFRPMSDLVGKYAAVGNNDRILYEYDFEFLK